MSNDLPTGWTLEIDEPANKIFLKSGNKSVVTKYTGQRKWFRGVGQHDQKRAAMWAWRFTEGYIDGFEIV